MLVACVSSLAGTVAQIVEALSISHCLDIQEEEDKRGISLMGYKDVFTPEERPKSQASIAPYLSQYRSAESARRAYAGAPMPRQAYASSAGSLPGYSFAMPGAPAYEASPGARSTSGLPRPAPGPIGGHSVLQLDGNCLSCTGVSAQVMSSFKMACLAYQPSDVSYKGNLYARGALLQLRANLLAQSAQARGANSWRALVSAISRTARSKSTDS